MTGRSPSGLGDTASVPSAAHIRELVQNAGPLLRVKHYTNSPHELGRRIGYIVPETKDIALSLGCRAARALQELAQIAASAIEARSAETTGSARKGESAVPKADAQ